MAADWTQKPVSLSFFILPDHGLGGFPSGLVVKNLPAAQEKQEMRVRSLGGEDPLEKGRASPVFLVESPRSRGAWWAAVHRAAESRTRLKRLSTTRIPGLLTSSLLCSLSWEKPPHFQRLLCALQLFVFSNLPLWFSVGPQALRAGKGLGDQRKAGRLGRAPRQAGADLGWRSRSSQASVPSAASNCPLP